MADLNTCDLHLSCFLIASGCQLKNYSRDKASQRVYFLFDESVKDPYKMREEYFAGIAVVNALKFANELKSLKALCHSLI
jgi:hypothetical protein